MAAIAHLKTQQVAEALGVSVSTVKRWVDSGELEAARTVGKHRLILAGSALAFARDRGLPHDRLERLAEGKAAAAPGRVEIGERTLDDLVLALVAGRAAEASDLIAGAYASAGAAALADRLIRPVMERIGHRWEFGVLDVYEEHRATHIIDSAIRELLREAAGRTQPGAPLAMGGSPEGDLYTIPTLLVELVLRDAGWDAVNLGPNIPLDSLARGVRQQRPGLVWLSVSCLTDPTRFLRDYRTLHHAAASTGTALVLGGRGLDPEIRAKIKSTEFGETLADLDAFARRRRDAIDSES